MSNEQGHLTQGPENSLPPLSPEVEGVTLNLDELHRNFDLSAPSTDVRMLKMLQFTLNGRRGKEEESSEEPFDRSA